MDGLKGEYVFYDNNNKCRNSLGENPVAKIKQELELISLIFSPSSTARPGVTVIRELDDRKKQVAKRLVRNFVESGIGPLYQDSECDKYTFEHEARIDRLGRLPICKTVCCKFPFALFKQKVEEDISH